MRQLPKEPTCPRKIKLRQVVKNENKGRENSSIIFLVTGMGTILRKMNTKGYHQNVKV